MQAPPGRSALAIASRLRMASTACAAAAAAQPRHFRCAEFFSGEGARLQLVQAVSAVTKGSGHQSTALSLFPLPLQVLGACGTHWSV